MVSIAGEQRRELQNFHQNSSARAVMRLPGPFFLFLAVMRPVDFSQLVQPPTHELFPVGETVSSIGWRAGFQFHLGLIKNRLRLFWL
jgi:hypothetical protein